MPEKYLVYRVVNGAPSWLVDLKPEGDHGKWTWHWTSDRAQASVYDTESEAWRAKRRAGWRSALVVPIGGPVAA